MASPGALYRHLPLVKHSLIALIGNTGLFVKLVCILLIIGYALSFSEAAVEVLSVTPGYLLPPTFWLWTAFTHCFLEVRLWQVVVDLVTLGLCGKLIEPLWGSFEMVLFFLLVNVCVAFISALFYLIIYMCTFNPEVSIRSQWCMRFLSFLCFVCAVHPPPLPYFSPFQSSFPFCSFPQSPLPFSPLLLMFSVVPRFPSSPSQLVPFTFLISCFIPILFSLFVLRLVAFYPPFPYFSLLISHFLSLFLSLPHLSFI